MYGKNISYEKMIIGIPSTNKPVQLANKFKSGIKSLLHSKSKSSALFQDFKMVIILLNFLLINILKTRGCVCVCVKL
jgi:hypothetical protein